MIEIQHTKRPKEWITWNWTNMSGWKNLKAIWTSISEGTKAHAKNQNPTELTSQQPDEWL
jgi:hypothetical protein